MQPKDIIVKKPINDVDAIEGKTIAKALKCQGAFLMRYTDGTFTALIAEIDSYRDNGALLAFDYYPEYPNMRELGVISAEEYTTILEVIETQRRNNEREQYEALKKKFEPQE